MPLLCAAVGDEGEGGFMLEFMKNWEFEAAEFLIALGTSCCDANVV